MGLELKQQRWDWVSWRDHSPYLQWEEDLMREVLWLQFSKAREFSP